MVSPTTSVVVPATLLLALLVPCISGASVDVNRTIDDQKGDSVTGVPPLFLPTDLWNIGQTCTACSIRAGHPIDPGQVFDGTWHDATHYSDSDPDRIVQVSFTGHAIYVYHTIVNILDPETSTRTNLTFYIDSEYVGSYMHNPTSNVSTPSVFYQMLVYSSDTLEQGEHTLQVIASGSSTVLILFDYAMYTTTVEDDSEPSPAPSQSPSQVSLPGSTASRITSQPPPNSSPQPSTHSSEASPTTPTITASSRHSSGAPGSPSPAPLGQSESSSSGSQTPTDTTSSSLSLSQPSQSLDVSSASHDRVSHAVDIGAIVGAIVGGVVFVGLAYLLYVLCRRRRIRGHRTGRARALPQYEHQQAEDPSPSPKLPSRGPPLLVPSSVETSSEPGGTSLSGTPQTERRILLAQQIQTLQMQVTEMRSLRMDKMGSERDPSEAAAMETSLSTMLSALRDEMAELRAELRERQYSYFPGVIPPSYDD
ncbi:hypothetical protein GY45DRAFT_1330060 [Cubamyces sp. BRFM 1775]|nr:hypothetical protein GY45DRAFT_1330060 [Cubamyces sp. BRFM 1775]